MKLTSFSITTFFQKQEIGYQEAGCYDKASCFFKRGKILSAGRLNKKSLGIVMLLSVGLLLAGCSGSKSSDTGTYSGSVYTVKRGGYAISYFAHHGNQRKRTGATERHFPPLTPLKLVRN